jgi:hypothetical protein
METENSDQRLRVFTHENIVHTQTALIEKLLKREVSFVVNLNSAEDRPNIQFSASKSELQILCNTLGHTIFVKSDTKWRPYF